MEYLFGFILFLLYWELHGIKKVLCSIDEKKEIYDTEETVKKDSMKETTKFILEYLYNNQERDLTSTDIAKVLKLTTKEVDGAVTAGLQRKNYAYRESYTKTLEDGSHKFVKFIKLTTTGKEKAKELFG